jgi:hypothetical protein
MIDNMPGLSAGRHQYGPANRQKPAGSTEEEVVGFNIEFVIGICCRK